MQLNLRWYMFIINEIPLSLNIEIILLGGNGFGKVHAKTYKDLGYDFSVYDRIEEVLKGYAEEYQVKRTYDDISAAINSECDVVDIVVPHIMHKEIALKAMKSKKHVLIEKPIATTRDDANSMMSESTKNKVKFMVAEQYFFDQCLKDAMRLISENKIGRVHTIITRDQRLFDKKGWRNVEGEMGGGALIDGGIHLVETMLDIGGPYEDIHAVTYNGGSSLEGEDNSVALFSFKNGAHGIFYYTWSYDHAPQLPSYEIVGSEGSIIEDMETKHKVDFKYQPSPRHAFGMPILNGKRFETEIVDVFDAEISGFLEAIEDDTEVPYSPELALRDLDAVLRIYGK